MPSNAVNAQKTFVGEMIDVKCLHETLEENCPPSAGGSGTGRRGGKSWTVGRRKNLQFRIEIHAPRGDEHTLMRAGKARAGDADSGALARGNKLRFLCKVSRNGGFFFWFYA